MILSPDGSKVYSDAAGGALYITTADDAVHFPPFAAGGELTASADGSTVGISGYYADSVMNLEAVQAYDNYETATEQGVSGTLLNGNGTILFVPLTDALDVCARNTGKLIYRVQLPVQVADTYRALFRTSEDTTVGVLIAGGVSFMDISSLPLSSTITSAFPGVDNGRALRDAPTKRFHKPAHARNLSASVNHATAFASLPPRKRL